MFFDVVEHLDPTGQTMVARIPRDGSGDFTTGSQLVVQDNQVAVFYRDGRMCDQFRGGRYTLSTQNLPLLKTLTKLVFKGKSPFRAYAYFVNLKTFIDLGWGTPNRILYRDAEFKRGVNLGAFGTFSMKIVDHVLFLNTIVGTKGLEDTAGIEDYLKKLVASRFADALAGVQTSVYDLPGKYTLIAAKLKHAVAPDFAQYGVALVDLAVVNITLPEEVTARINERARLDMYDADDIAKAQRLAVADTLPTAAANPGMPGTLIGAGLGFGMGMPMGQAMAGQMAAATQPMMTPPGMPPPMVQWYAFVNGAQFGPLNPQQLAGAIQAGQVNAQTPVWRQGMPNWVAASQVPDLGWAFGAPPPPPVGPPPPPPKQP
jgi:membrane protease subunit (stomatin/prohibitin family)